MPSSTCPKCSAKIRIADGTLRKIVACPNLGARVTVGILVLFFAIFATAVADDSPKMINGEIVKIEGSKIVVTTKDGEKVVWAVGRAAPVVVDGKQSDYDVLKPGVKVSIQADGDDAKKIRVIGGDAGVPSKVDADANSKPSDSRLAEIEENIAIAKANIKSPDSKTRAGAFEFLAAAATEKDAVPVTLPIIRDAIERERDGKVLEKALKAIAKQGTTLAGLAKTIEPLLDNSKPNEPDCQYAALEAMAAFSVYSPEMVRILFRESCNCVSGNSSQEFLAVLPAKAIVVAHGNEKAIDEILRVLSPRPVDKTRPRSAFTGPIGPTTPQTTKRQALLLFTLAAVQPENPKVVATVAEHWQRVKDVQADNILRYLESRLEELSQSSDETKAKAATRALRELQQTVKASRQGK